MTTTRLQQGWRIDQLNFSYGPAHCLKNISATIEPGLFYGLVGPNGSGKSTLIDIFSAYLQPSGGSIQLEGKNLPAYKPSELARMLTVVPQSFSFNFDFTVYETVMMGRHPHIPRFSTPRQDDFLKVEQALKLLDIDQLGQRSIRQLSGGEKQRVIIARALAQETDYILLDEVTANLDINHAISIMQTMKDLVKRGKTVIAALHDLNMALAYSDQVLVMNDGKLERFGPAAEIINQEMIEDIYQVPAEIIRAADGSPHLFFAYR
jgi:iron complex transport system ATP-binding protein